MKDSGESKTQYSKVTLDVRNKICDESLWGEREKLIGKYLKILRPII